MEPKGLNAIPLPNEAEEICNSNVQGFQGLPGLPGFLKNFKQDDIILLIIIVLLITDSGLNDKILLGLLVFIFISGIDGNIFGL